jgi:ornithine carbamoyltransferase
MSLRHFLTLNDLSADEAQTLIARASELKSIQRSGAAGPRFENKVLGMIFEKSSTRTRISFEAAMTHFGGSAIFLSPQDTQLGRGEPIEDSARVLSSMLDMVMIRTFEHSKLEKFAAYSSVPVINGLTDDFHPCQLLADMQTFFEQRGSIKGKTVAWIGDGNNMCHSYINATKLFDFHLNIACPKGYLPRADLLEENTQVSMCSNTADAVQNADLVVTDVWASMGQEQEQTQRLATFSDYQVNTELMDKANSDAIFMHCLPAHRGEEVSAELMSDPRAVVWDEAENRLHAQKALMELLFNSYLN